MSNLYAELDAIAGQHSQASGRQDWLTAFELAIQGYRASKDSREYRLMFLGLIRQQAVDMFDRESTVQSMSSEAERCSFCLRARSDLVRGTEATICSDCVNEASNALSDASQRRL